MQRVEGIGRGFSVSHTRVALELNFADSSSSAAASSSHTVAQGYAELTVIPSDKNLRSIHLNARQISISRITCSGQEVEFSLVDHMSALTISDPKDVHLYPELKRKLFAASSDAAGGELSILLPADAVRDADNEQAGVDFEPILIRIYYSVVDSDGAIHVLAPTDESPYRVPHMYTCATAPDATRSWMPCVDSLWERCTWELEFVVPAELEGEPMSVVASGDLTEKVVHPHNPHKIVYYYVQGSSTSAQHIGFAAGPFVLYDIPLVAKREETSGRALAFCLPGREEEMFNSVAVVHQSLDFYSREFGSYPFGSMKVVFVDEPIHDVHNTATLTICSSDLLYPRTVIDQGFETKQVLSHCVAFQWIGINIIQKTWSDTWLVNGLSLYITGLFMRRLLGNNEYRFRLKKDCDRLLTWDIGMPPLYVSGRQEPPEEDYLAFINLKAPLVMHTLDRRLCKAGASLGLGRVIPKVFLQAITGEMVNATLSTSNFLRTCRKVSGIDLRKYADQWIYGSGCPTFVCNANFNKKKLLVEFNFHQYSPSWDYAQRKPLEAAGSNPIQVFEGQLTVRIHEADGTPYEHVFDLNAAQKRFEVPFNTKYKRVRRNTKRFKSRQAAAKAAAEGDEGAAEDISLMDLGFGLGMWEEEEQREKWRVADWTEEDEAQMSSAPYEWIRLDADFEWIAHFQFDQRDYMWVSQLQRDRDVVAQAAAIQALGRMPNAITSSMLTRTVLVSKYFFRIRIEAIMQLVGCAHKNLDYLGLFHLLMLFRTAHCHDTGDFTDIDVPCIPKANDFSDFAEYFVKRALIQAISNVRNEFGRTLPQVKRLLINLLRYNDNSKNRFVDDFHTATLISCLAHAFVPLDSQWGQYVPANEDPSAQDDDELLQEARMEVERFQELDRLVPSYHNVVTMASLDFQANLMLGNLIPVNLPLLHAYTRQGNYVPLRVAALDYLLLLYGLQHKVLTRYFFALLRSDESRVVKRALARSICQCMTVTVAIGEKREHGLVEGDAAKSEEEQLEEVLKTIRREVGRSASVREGFLEALLHARADTGERWALIKLGELLFKPSVERDIPYQPRLSVRVRMPTGNDQTAETALTTPTTAKIKLIRSDAQPRVAFNEITATKTNVPKETPPIPAAATTKKKKAKPVAPGQASGMSLADLTACRTCLKKLQNSKRSQLFRKPVDPVRDKAPDYFNVIAMPMDLSSIENKLNEGMYKDRHEFKDDFELVISNAKTYTPDPKAFVHVEANALNREFQTLWTRISKTLAQAAANSLSTSINGGEVKGAKPDTHTAQDAEANSSQTLEEEEEEEEEPIAATTVVAKATPPSPKPVSMAPPSTGPLKGLKIKFKARPPASEETPVNVKSDSPAPPPPAPPKEKSFSPKISTSPAPGTAPRPRSSSPQKTNGSHHAIDTEKRPIQKKKCKQLLQTLKKMPEAFFFLRPVDPIADGAPTYYDEIKEPMDLGTMESKLDADQYSTMADFHADMQRIFDNCRQFNPPATVPVEYADILNRAFDKEWKIVNVLKLEYNEVRSLQALLTKLKAAPEADLFLHPVDPVALGIPHYFNVIPRKDARDLTTIESNLKSGTVYHTLSQFDADVRLMLHNCLTFNADVPDILEMTRSFARQYDKLWSDVCSKLGVTTSKRKAGDAGSAAAKRKK